MFAFAAHPLLFIAASLIDISALAFIFWACVRLVGWDSPLRWIIMWLAVGLASFIGFSAHGPLQPYGVFAGPSNHLWEPSLFGLAFSMAVASAGTIGVWQSNRTP